MSLSLKAELETWAAAIQAYDEQDFKKSLDLFSRIADSSKILTNMGLIYATIGEHETAVEHFAAATNLDSYLAIAHFQCGVSNFLLERYDIALLNFEDAYLYLRGNEAINYEQLGLKFKLFSAEIMFNKGLAQINLGYVDGGMTDMQAASKQKVTDEHRVINEAIRDRGEGYTVFSIPVGVLYRPSENKLKNSKSKDYLGKAKLVAASDFNDAFTEFTGVKKLRQASGESLDNKVDKDKPDAESSVLSNSAIMPAPHADPVAAPLTTLERSRTALALGARVAPDTAAILALRRTQSVSNPANTPSPPPYPSDLSRNNSVLSRSNSRLARSPATMINAGVMPLRIRLPQGTADGIAGVDAGGSRAGGETRIATGAPTALQSRPSLRRPKVQVAPPARVAPQSAPQSPLQSLPQGQHVKATRGVTPLVLPAAPPLVQGEGQFYDAYIDAYTDDPTRPPIPRAQSSASSSQRQSPAESSFSQQSPHEQQQIPACMQSAPSPSSGMSRAPPSVASVGVGASRRRPTRRMKGRRVTAYDDDEGDDGFVTGENDELEMANIRVKLHYQGDVRGMTIPPTTSFHEFVERVTAKFETSLMGLGMKFMDEDGTKISLRDESDFELAIETARESAKGWSEGKMEVWCVDV